MISGRVGEWESGRVGECIYKKLLKVIGMWPIYEILSNGKG